MKMKKEISGAVVKEWVHNGVVLITGEYCDFSDTVVLSLRRMNHRIIDSKPLIYN